MINSLNPMAAWLLTYALHSTLLLGGVLLFARRARSAALRELLCKIATFAALLTASAQSLVPERSRVEPLAGRWELQVSARTIAESAAQPSNPVAQSAASNSPILAAPVSSTPPPTQSSPTMRVRTWARLPNWPVVVLALWSASAIVGITVFTRRYLRMRRRFATRRSCSDAQLNQAVNELRSSAGFRAPVRLTVSDVIVSPVALTRREICVPAGLVAKLTSAQQCTMLAHELAHLVRRDPYWLLAFGWMEGLFFLQPLNRLARREFQRAAEELCDQFALRQTQQPIALAQCLAEVATWLRGDADVFPYPAMAERASPLLRRVERVLQGAREPLTVSARVRWLAAGAVLAFACIAPAVTGAARLNAALTSPGAAGDIAAAVRAIGSGVVRFSFATRAGICGTGEEKDGTRMFALQPTAEWLPAGKPDMLALYVWDGGKLMRNDVGTDGKWTTPCEPGNARVDLRVENGSIARVDLSVANPAPRIAGVMKDVGEVEPARAAEYLVQLARASDRVTADRSLLGAVMARDGVTPRTLRELETIPHLRTAAERWLAALDHGAARTTPQQQNVASPELRVVADLDAPFEKRMTALEVATHKGLKAAELMTVYPRVPDRAMRVELIDWLHARENASVREFLKDIVRNAAVLEEQQAALRALAQSPDASARAWAAEYRKRHEPANKPLDARAYTYTDAPQSVFAQRVAAVRDGIAHVTYDVRPEACGTGIDADGAGMFALLPTDRWKPASSDESAALYSFDPDDFTTLAIKPDPSWTRGCQRGPGHLFLDVRAGKVTELRLAVAGPLRSVTIDADLGRVSGPEAANYLLELASSGPSNVATNAILAAVMAGGEPTIYRELVRIAADASRPEKVRGTALHWAALDPTPGAAELIRRNMDSLPHAPERSDNNISEPRATLGESNAYVLPKSSITVESAIGIVIDEHQQMAARKKAIEWVHERAERPALVAALYEVIRDRDLQLYLVEYLAKVDEELVAKKLIQIAGTTSDSDIRRAAEHSLSAQKNAVARSYRR